MILDLVQLDVLKAKLFENDLTGRMFLTLLSKRQLVLCQFHFKSELERFFITKCIKKYGKDMGLGHSSANVSLNGRADFRDEMTYSCSNILIKETE